MYNTNVTQARAILYNLVNMAIEDNEVININSKNSNAILMSEDDYRDSVSVIESGHEEAAFGW